MAGSAIFISIWVVHVRKRAFEHRFGALVKSQREQLRLRRKTHSDSRGQLKSRSQTLPLENLHAGADEIAVESAPETNPSEASTLRASQSAPTNMEHIRKLDLSSGSPDHISFAPTSPNDSNSHMPHKRRNSSVFSFAGVGAAPVATTAFRRPGQDSLSSRQGWAESIQEEELSKPKDSWPKFLTRGVIGRNSQFHGLTYEEREQLGGVEYKAITLLSWIVPVYFVAWQLLSCLGMGVWMAYHASDITRGNGINPWLVDIIASCSMKLTFQGGLVPSIASAPLITPACRCSTQIWYEHLLE